MFCFVNVYNMIVFSASFFIQYIEILTSLLIIITHFTFIVDVICIIKRKRKYLPIHTGF